MKAVVIQESGKVAVKDIPEPPVRDDYVKIRTHAVALNPTDWKHVDRMPTPGTIVGCDVAGTVTEVGSAVTSTVKVGDRIAGVTHGSNATNLRDGCFAEFAQIKDGLFAHIPSDWDFAQASTLGVGLTTVGQGLYESLGLPMPDAPSTTKTPVLIYGGSTATGSLAIQFARLSGLQVLTVASRTHHAWLKTLGADACFDYHDADCGAQIREFTQDKLHHVLDCITEGDSLAISAAALTSAPTADAPALYSGLLAPKGDFPRADVKTAVTLAYHAFGEFYVMGDKESPAKPESHAFGSRFWHLSESLLADGKVKNHPTAIREGGLEGIEHGLDELRQGKVRGEKIVYVL